MELLTPRLHLDALRRGDAAALFAYRADPAVNRYQGWRPSTLDEVVQFIDRQQSTAFGALGNWCQLALRRRDSDMLMGDLGVHFVDADTLELGITLAPANQSHGFAAEAMRAALQLAFSTLGRHRVFASVDPRNLACVRLLERLGLRREAWFRDDGEGFADDVVYALLAREWRALAPVFD